MGAYIIRRILYAIPILLFVNIFTFILFFFVNTPDDVAHVVLGTKHVQSSDIHRWKREHGYHLPRLWNGQDTLILISKGKEWGAHPAGLERYHKISWMMPLDGSPDFLSLGDRLHANTMVLIHPDRFQPEEAALLLKYVLEPAVPVIVMQTDNAAEAVFRESLCHFVDKDQLIDVVEQTQVRGLAKWTETLFFKKSVRLFWFDFGQSDRENIAIGQQILKRMGPSLCITVPAFFLALCLNISIAMMVAFYRASMLDRSILFLCIVMMSIVILFYIFSSQVLFGQWLKWFPVSGYQPGLDNIRFILLPVLISVLGSFGPGVRFYRTVFLEESNRDYIRTARAKGLTERTVMFRHALKNAMLPILTNVVVVIPTLFVGSLLLESFFAIPGLGRFTLEGIWAQDFRVVGSMVYLGSFLYVVSLILTDVSYTLFDPRVRLS